MEQAKYEQMLASLEGLTEAQIDTLLKALSEREAKDDGSGGEKTAEVEAVQPGTPVAFFSTALNEELRRRDKDRILEMPPRRP